MPPCAAGENMPKAYQKYAGKHRRSKKYLGSQGDEVIGRQNPPDGKQGFRQKAGCPFVLPPCAAGEKERRLEAASGKEWLMKRVYFSLALLTGGMLLIFEFLQGALGASRMELLFGVLLLLGIVTMAGIDIQKYEIPNFVQLYFLILGILRALLERQHIGDRVLAFFLMGGLLLAIAMLSGGMLGGGDIKLMALAGLSLGTRNVFLALALGSIVGSIVGIGLILAGKIKRDTPLPFGAFLGAGIFLAYLYGDRLWQWYFN